MERDTHKMPAGTGMMQSEATGTYPGNAHKVELFLDCVHCGLCLPQCPTYRELGQEGDSPRGRIYLMRAVEEGVIPWTRRAVEHVDLCLGCRACESACPAGVHYGRMLEEARDAIEKKRVYPLRVRWLRRFVFNYLFLSPARLRAAFLLMRVYQWSGLRWFATRTGLLRLISPRLAELDPLLPPIPFSHQGLRTGRTLAPYGPKRHRVAFFVGCVMNELMGDIQQASIEVLRHNGCEVIIPAGQACCGALHSHSGELELALRLVEKNTRIFAPLQVDSIITNAAGCGAMLKEYRELGRKIAGLADAAARMASRVEDITEFLARIGLKIPAGHLDKRVGYDDPCHLVHGQKISRQPRQVLKSIPGIRWTEIPNADHCCGSAGTYNVMQFNMSMQVLERKMRAIASVKPDIVATGNPGCLLQLRYGAKRFSIPVEIRHPVELLAESYRNKE
jgi:glycolate oxidase iron-sulfur subunit